ncbi:molecular chaperone DnaJ [Leptospira fluminis]|uniref:Molecular chaperone DnaJ n=1 Tax=Leptospira fluminis TaxID=2484979 RepID=A0A4R9GMQ7_9LEPT|nr:molecular chaperone DnaJ [Leptospira fluminis]
MEDGDLLSRALDFYGLPKKYDENLVRSRFRELSRKYHPDSGEYESDILFKELVRLRDVLLQSLEEAAKKSPSGDSKEEDRNGFADYKSAKQSAADALEIYFKRTEGNPVFLQAEENPELRILRTKLSEAKSALERFILSYPDSLWKSDAEDTLKKIGVWFRG